MLVGRARRLEHGGRAAHHPAQPPSRSCGREGMYVMSKPTAGSVHRPRSGVPPSRVPPAIPRSAPCNAFLPAACAHETFVPASAERRASRRPAHPPPQVWPSPAFAARRRRQTGSRERTGFKHALRKIRRDAGGGRSRSFYAAREDVSLLFPGARAHPAGARAGEWPPPRLDDLPSIVECLIHGPPASQLAACTCSGSQVWRIRMGPAFYPSSGSQRGLRSSP